MADTLFDTIPKETQHIYISYFTPNTDPITDQITILLKPNLVNQ